MGKFLLGVWAGSGVVLGYWVAEENPDDKLAGWLGGLFWPITIPLVKLTDRLD